MQNNLIHKQKFQTVSLYFSSVEILVTSQQQVCLSCLEYRPVLTAVVVVEDKLACLQLVCGSWCEMEPLIVIMFLE